MKKFVAELIGTFMLVFVGTGAVVFGNGLDGLGHLGIAFAFGLAIVVAAYSIGTVSGAHLNPAVSIAGLVIGLSLMAMILVGLKITGLSVNPARSLAPAVLVGGAALQQVWIFILAPIAGGVLAALVAKNFLGTEE
ncbi:aquaporin Z-water channel protein [Streptococcus pneumoniae]|nr:aquaporin Z-water channel protein [Streptococcus pneumoniae]